MRVKLVGPNDTSNQPWHRTWWIMQVNAHSCHHDLLSLVCPIDSRCLAWRFKASTSIHHWWSVSKQPENVNVRVISHHPIQNTLDRGHGDYQTRIPIASVQSQKLGIAYCWRIYSWPFRNIQWIAFLCTRIRNGLCHKFELTVSYHLYGKT